jgi:hypothetical protein
VSIDRHFGRFFVHLGNGTGGFDTLNPTGQVVPGAAPLAIAVGHYDNDGRPDIAIARDGQVQIWTGSATGNFFGPLDIAFAGVTPLDIVFTDVDDDGRDDLVVVGGTSVAVALRAPNPGTFQAPVVQAIPNATQVRAVQAADVDTDGHVDLVIAIHDATTPSIRWLAGNSTGAFAHSLQRSWHVPTAVSDLALADLDGDGHLDAITTHVAENALYVRLGNGQDGTGMFGTQAAGGGEAFAHANTALSQGRGLAIADYDGDGVLDAAVSIRSGGWTNSYVYLFWGDGDGGFTSATTDRVRTFSTLPAGLVTDDFAGDGIADLWVMSSSATTSETAYSASYATPLVNDGSGRFFPSLAPSYGTTNSTANAAWGVEVTDVDGDGDVDIAFTVNGAGRVAVSLGNGRGGFSIPESYVVGSQPKRIVGADLNGNTVPELVVANTVSGGCSEGNPCFSALANLGGGVFGSNHAQYGLTTPAVDLIAGHFDGDAEIDVITLGDAGSGTDDEFFSTHLSTGPLAFGGAVVHSLAALGTSLDPYTLAAGDFDDDGNLDIALQGNSMIEVWHGNGNGTFTSAGAYPAGGSPNVVHVTDVNNDGDLDIVVGLEALSHNVVVFFGDGSGLFDENDTEARTVPNAYPTAIAMTELNGDCLLDLVVTADYTGDDDDGLYVFLTAP